MSINMNPIMEDHNQMTPNYTFMFEFEKRFKPDDTKEWMMNYCHTSFYAVAIYMIVIFGGQAYMSNRPAFKLKKPLILWNVGLALFSIVGTFRTLPEMLHVLNNFGFKHSVCSSSFIESVKPSGFWTWMFALSKVPELGDTVFIVLRKQNLIFLHWYHHITVLLYTWYTYGEYTGAGRWFVYMNFMVHSLMYSYYALRSLGIRLPKQLAMVITTSQIIQMMMGAFVIYYAYYRKSMGDTCNMSDRAATLGLLMYSSYFVLFAHFFYNAYFVRDKKSASNGSPQTKSAGGGIRKTRQLKQE